MEKRPDIAISVSHSRASLSIVIDDELCRRNIPTTFLTSTSGNVKQLPVRKCMFTMSGRSFVQF